MSEEQFSALLAKLAEDSGLREKLQGAADLDAFVALAKEAGFDVSKADWLRYQAKQTLKLSDEELEGMAGGAGTTGKNEYCGVDTGFWGTPHSICCTKGRNPWWC